MEHKHEDENLDPVCGMMVTKDTAACSYEYQGKTYYFCAASCKEHFAADPMKFVKD